MVVMVGGSLSRVLIGEFVMVVVESLSIAGVKCMRYIQLR